MKHIELAYTLHTQRPDIGRRVPPLRNPMMDVLHSVREDGSISAAARRLGYSYRHVWGQLKAWEAEWGQALIVWERGQPARLSPFGERLLMAERLAQARLGPQLDHLRAELERAFALAFEDPTQDRSPTLTVYASHDHALSELQAHAALPPTGADRARLHLDLRFCGSVDAIRALNDGRCRLAGFHVGAEAETNGPTARALRPLLRPGLHKIVGLAWRTQGLLVPRGNPLGLHSLREVIARGARFVNRAPGTGTRLLLEELLAREGLTPSDLPGFGHEEASHAAVAAAVAGGAADVGLGATYAAVHAGLDSVPLARERYLLVGLKSALEQPAVQALLDHLRSSAWQRRLHDLPGYAADRCGEVESLKRLLPWWEG